MTGRLANARRALALAAVVVLVTALVPIVPAYGVTPLAVVYVSAATGSDATGTGAMSAPFKSITYALGYVASGSVIWVLPGSYLPGPEGFPIELPPGVALRSLGGPNVTTIDAEGLAQVVSVHDATPGTVVSGFTITGGSAPSIGGGVWISRDDPVADEPDWPRIEECTIADNSAVTYGGGIGVSSASASSRAEPMIVGCVIEGNSTATPGDGYGGGVYGEWHSLVQLYDSIIRYNHADYGGGGANLASSSVVVGCEIAYNTADTDGGGLRMGPGSYIADCWIHDNQSTWYAGGIDLEYVDGAFTVERCRIEGNTAFQGAGMTVGGASSVELNNLVIAGNTAESHGGAIYLDPSPSVTMMEVALRGSTVVANVSTSGFDGIYCSPDTNVTITDSIIGHEPVVPGDSSTCEDVYGSYVMSYSSPRDPDLVGTGVVYGYPMFMDEAAGNYELMLGSPCIDTGDPASTLIDDVLARPRPEDANGDGVQRVDMGAYERPQPLVSRIAGSNRYATAGLMAQWREWSGGTAVLASGEGFPDALSGSGLAGAYGGPLLLTAKNSCPGYVFDALQDVGASEVVIVGGTAAVSETVAQQLRAVGYAVRRIAGQDRYATAAAVAQAIADELGVEFVHKAFLARGDDFADALSCSPFAYSGARPVLLTRTGSLPASTAAAITGLGITEVAVIGGTTAVSAGVMTAVDNLPGVACVRIAGANRYATAAGLASWGVANGYATWNQVGIATGTNFPDGLAGGALCGIRRGVLLLTQSSALPAAIYTALNTNRAQVVYAEIYGGTTAVSDGVRTAVRSALGW